jgi:hypothetical protein
MIELKGFPMRNQLADVPSADRQPSENRVYNCVPTCLAACIQWYTGKKIPADDLHDAVYGQGHVGGGAELSYTSYVKAHYGLALGYTPLPSASQQIIEHTRSELRLGHPVVLTMHSAWSTPWAKAAGSGLHVGVAYAISEDDAGVLHIMNPWRGFDHAAPVSWWRDRLGIGVWPVSKIAVASVLPAGFSWNKTSGVLTWPNGQVSSGGIGAKTYADVLSGAWQAGYPQRAERKIADAHGMLAFQTFGSATIIWRPGWDEPRYATDAEMSDLISEGTYMEVAA